MRYEQDPDRTRLDPYPVADPPTEREAAVSRTPAPPPVSAPRATGAYEDELVEEGVANPDYRRIRTVGMVVHRHHGHHRRVRGRARRAHRAGAGQRQHGQRLRVLCGRLGRRHPAGPTGLFTPGNAKVATLLNEGLAAILWLAIGALLTYLIRRFALPGPRRLQRYRRVVR